VTAAQVGSMFLLVKEAADLRGSVTKSMDMAMQTKVQFSVGPTIIGLGKVAISFVDDVPPEAKMAISAMRNASVGVYELDRMPSADQRIALWEATGQSLESEGWTRIVSFNENHQSVMVFMPNAARDTDELEVCVIVCDGRELVIVSATADSKPLVELVRGQMGDWSDWSDHI
jgi:hypothetical protein